MPARPDKTLVQLGRYLSMALTLPSSVFAGYLLGEGGNRWLHIPFLRVLGIMLGMTVGLIKVFEELSRAHKKDTRQ